MSRFFSLLPCCALVFLTTVAAAQVPVIYDPALADLASVLDLPQLEPWDGTTTTTPSMFLSVFGLPPGVPSTAYDLVLPLAIAPICLAYHKTTTTIAVSPTEIANTLTGASIASALSNTTFVLGDPTTSPTSAMFLQRLNAMQLPGFTSNSASWPAAVVSNPRVTIVNSDAAVSAHVSQTANAMGPQCLALTFAASVPCAQIRMSTSFGDTVAFSTQLDSTTVLKCIVNVTTAAITVIPGLAYPFVGTLQLHASTKMSCDAFDTLQTVSTTMVSNASIADSLTHLGFFQRPPPTLYSMMEAVESATTGRGCASRTECQLYVDGSLIDMIPVTRAEYTMEGHGFLQLVNQDTATNIKAVTSSATHFALVEALPSVVQQQEHPSVKFAPVLTHSMSMSYNLPGINNLMLSPCTVLGLLNGSITQWDDPAVIKDNVGTNLPSLPVTRMLCPASAVEGTLRGVNSLIQQCPSMPQVIYPLNGTWPFSVDVTTPCQSLGPAILTLNGAVSLVATPIANLYGLQTSSITLAPFQSFGPTANQLAAAWSSATMDSTGLVNLRLDTHAYPFVIEVYAAIDVDAYGGCTEYKAQLDWLQWCLFGNGDAILASAGFMTLSSAIMARSADLISNAKCDGQLLYPQAAAPTVPIWPYLLASGAIVVILLAVGGLRLRRWFARRVRPLNSDHAYCVAFVGIKNEADVRDSGAANTAAVIKAVASMVHTATRRNDCYEARRIDECTVMVVSKQPDQILRFAEDVMASAVSTDWEGKVMTSAVEHRDDRNKIVLHSRRSVPNSRPSDHELLGKKISHVSIGSGSRSTLEKKPSTDFVSSHADEAAGSTPKSNSARKTTSSFSTGSAYGPQLYIGVHMGQGGITYEVQQDTVSYHGPAVQRAAEVADVAVGGQIAASIDFVDALEELEIHVDGRFESNGAADRTTMNYVSRKLSMEQHEAVRKRINRKGTSGHGSAGLSAALAKADGSLSRRMISVVSMTVPALIASTDDLQQSSEVVKALQELAHGMRGEVLSVVDGVVTVTVGASAAVSLVAVRACAIAAAAVQQDLAEFAGVSTGAAVVGSMTGDRPVALGGIASNATLMRLTATALNIPVASTDSAYADLFPRFTLATVDAVAAPWDAEGKPTRVIAILAERDASGPGEWMYNFDGCDNKLEKTWAELMLGQCAAVSPTEPSSTTPPLPSTPDGDFGTSAEETTPTAEKGTELQLRVAALSSSNAASFAMELSKSNDATSYTRRRGMEILNGVLGTGKAPY